MKKIVCALMAGSMLFASCSGQKKQATKSEPTTPATKTQIDQTNNQIDQGLKDQNNNSSNGLALNTSVLNSAVTALMNKSEMFIKTADGANVSIEEYQLNPSQYYMLMIDKKDSSKYMALKTSHSAPIGDEVTVNFDVFVETGKIADFKAANLSAPKMQDKLKLSSNILKMSQNKEEILALKARVVAKEFASNGLLQGISDFMFPKAYGMDYQDKLMWTAIGFTIGAVVSYIFSFYWVGNISTAVAIVFWLLFAFES